MIADNASSAGFVIGRWQPPATEVGNLGILLKLDGHPVEIGSTAAILGHPLRSLVAAAELVARWGERLEPGSLVLAGGATAAAPLAAGQHVCGEFQTLGTVEVHVELGGGGSRGMTDAAALKLYFNFRSPYCYLASKTMWDLFEAFHVELVWRPLGGLGRPFRSRAGQGQAACRAAGPGALDRAARHSHDPAAGDLRPPRGPAPPACWPNARGVCAPTWSRPCAWPGPRAATSAISRCCARVARRSGLDPAALCAAADAPEHRSALQEHAAEARRDGVFGVPSLVIGEAVFWGNDRLDFLQDHLKRLRLSRA